MRFDLRSLSFCVALFSAAMAPAAPKATPIGETILLWPNGAPGAAGSEDVDKPTLTYRLPPPEKNVHTAIVVCPGGGYGGHAMGHEGNDIADFLIARGVAVFILKYRLGPRYQHPAPLQDAQRAIRTVRANAEKFAIEPNKVGIWGFSAGGHLASTAATHFDAGDMNAGDPIDKASCRPDFAILGYPVISMENGVTHAGSKKNLLGPNPDDKMVEYLSNDKQVTAQTPPTFLFHTSEDVPVPPENSLRFYGALKKAGVPAELHIFEKGKHGVGLAAADPVLSLWPTLLQNWLQQHGLLGAK